MSRMFAFENAKRRRFDALIHAANCCNLCALVFALFAVFSPYYLWGSFYSNGVKTTMATGPWVAAATSSTFDCGFWCVGVLESQWVYWGEIDSDEACTGATNVFPDWSGRYGFCDEVGGEYSKTREVRVVQAFTVLTLIFLVFALILGCCAAALGAKAAITAGLLSLLTMIFAIVAFSTVAASEWYDDLLEGRGSLPFYDSNGRLIAVTDVDLHYGPSFVTMILVFVLTFFATLAYCLGARGLRKALSGNNKDVPEDVPAQEVVFS